MKVKLTGIVFVVALLPALALAAEKQAASKVAKPPMAGICDATKWHRVVTAKESYLRILRPDSGAHCEVRAKRKAAHSQWNFRGHLILSQEKSGAGVVASTFSHISLSSPMEEQRVDVSFGMEEFLRSSWNRFCPKLPRLEDHFALCSTTVVDLPSNSGS